jgi:hypothetical protein
MGIDAHEREQLQVLLAHWIEHNMEHAREFRKWAPKAGASSIQIEAAASLMEDANRELEAALQGIGGSRSIEP